VARLAPWLLCRALDVTRTGFRFRGPGARALSLGCEAIKRLRTPRLRALEVKRPNWLRASLITPKRSPCWEWLTPSSATKRTREGPRLGTVKHRGEDSRVLKLW